MIRLHYRYSPGDFFDLLLQNKKQKYTVKITICINNWQAKHTSHHQDSEIIMVERNHMMQTRNFLIFVQYV